MLRKLLVLCSLSAISALVGCGMCQDCGDYLGPVPGSVNHDDYEGSPRSGSAIGSPVYESAPSLTVPTQVTPAPISPGGSGSR